MEATWYDGMVKNAAKLQAEQAQPGQNMGQNQNLNQQANGQMQQPQGQQQQQQMRQGGNVPMPLQQQRPPLGQTNSGSANMAGVNGNLNMNTAPTFLDAVAMGSTGGGATMTDDQRRMVEFAARAKLQAPNGLGLAQQPRQQGQQQGQGQAQAQKLDIMKALVFIENSERASLHRLRELSWTALPNGVKLT
jgi:hypothetical protein